MKFRNDPRNKGERVFVHINVKKMHTGNSKMHAIHLMYNRMGMSFSLSLPTEIVYIYIQ